MKWVSRLCLMATMAFVPCFASTLYTFNYTGPGSSSSDVLPFSFDFTTPADLTVGDPFSFSAFNVSDTFGNTYSFTTGSLVAEGIGHCFVFGTASYGGPLDCSLTDPTAVGGAVMTWYSSLPQPVATDGVTPYYMRIAYLVQSTCGNCVRYGDGDANVVRNPEPATISMMLGGGMLLFGLHRRRRKA
jgi:hypothetical protein